MRTERGRVGERTDAHRRRSRVLAGRSGRPPRAWVLGVLAAVMVGCAAPSDDVNSGEASHEPAAAEGEIPVGMSWSGVADQTVSYGTAAPGSVSALVERADAAVRARAGDAVQERPEPGDPSYVVTIQDLEVIDRLWGDVGDVLRVWVLGGVTDGPSPEVQGQLVETSDEPQFTSGQEYLLLLEERERDGIYRPVGPAEGRYPIVEGNLRSVADDWRRAADDERASGVGRDRQELESRGPIARLEGRRFEDVAEELRSKRGGGPQRDGASDEE